MVYEKAFNIRSVIDRVLICRLEYEGGNAVDFDCGHDFLIYIYKSTYIYIIF